VWEALLFIIEHLEPEIGKWLYFEYAHASRIAGVGRLVFTNVKNLEDAKILSNFGQVKSESFIEIFSQDEILILDPKASESLKPEDLNGVEAFIIGGILGDHPPKGRTRMLITSKAPSALCRNIGVGQFSIDGAVYVAKLVSEGVRLESIAVKRGLHVRLNERAEIYLPYMYPLKDGKPIVSDELIRYLKSKELIRDEEKIFREDAERYPCVAFKNKLKR
jgi:ribosome biogenesis SPOUT family RNA methylase Rps3